MLESTKMERRMDYSLSPLILISGKWFYWYQIFTDVVINKIRNTVVLQFSLLMLFSRGKDHT